MPRRLSYQQHSETPTFENISENEGTGGDSNELSIAETRDHEPGIFVTDDLHQELATLQPSKFIF